MFKRLFSSEADPQALVHEASMAGASKIHWSHLAASGEPDQAAHAVHEAEAMGIEVIGAPGWVDYYDDTH